MSKFKYAFIMRGIPGSGKSTVAKQIALSGAPFDEETSWVGGEQESLRLVSRKNHEKVYAEIHSADFYFMNDGEYKFNPKGLGRAHNANYKAFRDSCEAGVSVVICDNTNTQMKEYRKYLDTATHQKYIVSTVVMPHPKVKVAVDRNTHGVPKEAIEKMISRFQ